MQTTSSRNTPVELVSEAKLRTRRLPLVLHNEGDCGLKSLSWCNCAGCDSQRAEVRIRGGPDMDKVWGVGPEVDCHG